MGLEPLSYKKDENKYEGMTLDSKLPIPDPPDTSQVIDINDETETTDNPLEDYYKDKIYRNHPNFHIIHKIYK